jgi:hypothetical protein
MKDRIKNILPLDNYEDQLNDFTEKVVDILERASKRKIVGDELIDVIETLFGSVVNYAVFTDNFKADAHIEEGVVIDIVSEVVQTTENQLSTLDTVTSADAFDSMIPSVLVGAKALSHAFLSVWRCYSFDDDEDDDEDWLPMNRLNTLNRDSLISQEMIVKFRERYHRLKRYINDSGYSFLPSVNDMLTNYCIPWWFSGFIQLAMTIFVNEMKFESKLDQEVFQLALALELTASFVRTPALGSSIFVDADSYTD